MHIQHRGPLFSAAMALLGTLLVSGCGGGSSSPAGSSGIKAQATLSGNTVSITAHTDRSDISSVWATAAGAQVVLTGSGQDWSGSVAVDAQPNTVVTVLVYAQDSMGNSIGPAKVQLTMGEYGTQPTVTGLIYESGGGPIEGATITLGNQSTATNSQGQFVITGLLSGISLQGVITKSGYLEQTFQVDVTTGTVDVGKITLTPTADLPPPAPVFP